LCEVNQRLQQEAAHPFLPLQRFHQFAMKLWIIVACGAQIGLALFRLQLQCIQENRYSLFVFAAASILRHSFV